MAEPSGPAWVARFPQSTSTNDLVEPFRSSVNGFLAALKAAGASVTISATLRPPERAYLMHWAWMIARAGQSPTTVPARGGVDIDWAHIDTQGAADVAAATRAAQQMVAAYDIAFQPALVSRHTQGLAIDMTIGWTSALTIKSGTGAATTITSPPKSGMNPDLQTVGGSYGVIKLATDPPHWSSDGH